MFFFFFHVFQQCRSPEGRPIPAGLRSLKKKPKQRKSAILVIFCLFRFRTPGVRQEWDSTLNFTDCEHPAHLGYDSVTSPPVDNERGPGFALSSISQQFNGLELHPTPSYDP